MLATRGAVYTSAAAAGQVVGRGKEMSLADRRDRAAGRTRSTAAGRGGQFIAGGRRARGAQKLGARFHDDCRCMAVAVRPGSSYVEPPYVEQWRKDYHAAVEAAREDGEAGRYGVVDPAVIARRMDNAPTGKTTLANEAKTKKSERARGRKGGPGGSIPPQPPKRGGKGYSYHDDERQLEWEYDQAVQRIAVDRAITLDELHVRATALQEYRSSRGIVGRLDERAGKQFDADERLIVDRLLSEDRNVSSISEAKTVQGRKLPDMFVDAKIAEIKTSKSDDAEAFGGRVGEVKEKQAAPNVYVNALPSGISRQDFKTAMSALIDRGDVDYVRVIGRDFDDAFPEGGDLQ